MDKKNTGENTRGRTYRSNDRQLQSSLQRTSVSMARAAAKARKNSISAGLETCLQSTSVVSNGDEEDPMQPPPRSNALVLRPVGRAVEPEPEYQPHRDSGGKSDSGSDSSTHIPEQHDRKHRPNSASQRIYREMYCAGTATQFNSEVLNDRGHHNSASKLVIEYSQCISEKKGLQFNACMSENSVLAILDKLELAKR